MKWLNMVIRILLMALSVCVSTAAGSDDEEEIPLSKVPTNVLKAATAAVKGIVLTEAEIEKEKGEIVYELEGKANGKEYEIKVTAQGKVLEIEDEDEDEDD